MGNVPPDAADPPAAPVPASPRSPEPGRPDVVSAGGPGAGRPERPEPRPPDVARGGRPPSGLPERPEPRPLDDPGGPKPSAAHAKEARLDVPGGPAAEALAGKPIGRRVILGMLGLGAAGILGGARVQDMMNKLLAPVQAADPTGLTGLIPAAGGFRIYSVSGSLPHEADADYRLKIDGMVDRPLTLSLADLQARPPTQLIRDFQCVTGWRVQGVHWTGVQLSALLDEAGVHSGAAALTFHSFDGTYTESLTLDQARRPDVIAAYQMLDGPVTRAHGGPVRLYVAPMYGYKSCKWLSGITVVPKVAPGYWENLGYDVDAWVGHSNERSDHPTV